MGGAADVVQVVGHRGAVGGAGDHLDAIEVAHAVVVGVQVQDLLGAAGPQLVGPPLRDSVGEPAVAGQLDGGAALLEEPVEDGQAGLDDAGVRRDQRDAFGQQRLGPGPADGLDPGERDDLVAEAGAGAVVQRLGAVPPLGVGVERGAALLDPGRDRVIAHLTVGEPGTPGHVDGEVDGGVVEAAFAGGGGLDRAGVDGVPAVLGQGVRGWSRPAACP